MKLAPTLAAVLLATVAFSLSAVAQPLPLTTPADAGFSAERLSVLHRNIDALVDAGKYSGYITLIARDGRIVDWQAHGWQDIEGKVPLQKDSIVRIFSMSKIITSVGILMLMEDGKLQLADPVEKYLPVLKNRQVLTGGTADAPVLVPASRPITIRDLLTHTAGYYYPEPWSADAVPSQLMARAKLFEADNLDDFVQRVAAIPLHQQPGTKFRYGIHTDLLGAIIEKVSGQRLDLFLQDRIFAPLQMTDTAFWVPSEKRARLAKVYTREASGRLVPNQSANNNRVTPEHGLMSGGGGLYSTAGDYARFAQMLLNEGELGGTRLLSPKTVEMMRQNHIANLADPHPFNRPELGFGLGVRMITDLGRSPFLGSTGMFGWDGAATTLVWMDPQERTVAIFLAQHMPFDQDAIFTTFANGYNAAIVRK
jgi:CubicO group peptidase (beta-lactamase class C family)